MGALFRSFTAVIVEAVLATLRMVFKKDVVAENIGYLIGLRDVLNECIELVDATITAATPDQDGVIRFSDDEIGSILDEADDIPAAVARMTGGGGDA